MKVGILGGTFDPIHNAHIKIAQETLEQFKLDKILIMPTPYPPHKDKDRITSNFHRANMVKLAITPFDKIEFSDFELNSHDVTYTADTLHMLKELHPENEYYFIVGSDSIASFMSWYRPDVILKFAKLIAVKRDDESSKKMDAKIAEIEEKFHVPIQTLSMKALDISSSYIRCNDYAQIKSMVPEAVYEYIVENKLYCDENVNKAWSINKITEDLETQLKPSRFKHILGVAQTAKEMAEHFKVNPNKAYFAGILHDCAKNKSDSELISICHENNIEITDAEQKQPYLLHAKAGAYLAKTKYGITDKEILSAITWHTTGKENMSVLDKIIFCADYIEPTRTKQPNLEYLRNIANKDLDLLVYNILKDTMEYLQQSGKKSIDENTKNAYLYYKKVIEER
jgi:nicotinate-nucleotide adenylyltransferase